MNIKKLLSGIEIVLVGILIVSLVPFLALDLCICVVLIKYFDTRCLPALVAFLLPGYGFDSLNKVPRWRVIMGVSTLIFSVAIELFVIFHFLGWKSGSEVTIAWVLVWLCEQGIGKFLQSNQCNIG